MSKLTPDPLVCSPDEGRYFMEVFDCTRERHTHVALAPSMGPVFVRDCLPAPKHALFLYVSMPVMLTYNVCVCARAHVSVHA